jgi:hypothetical protein
MQGLDEINKIDLPVKPAYWLSRFTNKVVSEAKAFDTVRMKLIDKYSEKDEKGKPVIDDKSKEYKLVDREAFAKEFEELVEQEFEIDYKPVKLADLGDVKIKPVILAKLEKIIEI